MSRPRALLAAAVLSFAACLGRFALARPSVEVTFPRLELPSPERRNLAFFRLGPTVRVSSADYRRRHHPGYLVDGAPAPSLAEKWASAPGDPAPWAEVALREPHQVEEVAVHLAGAREAPGLSPRRFRLACFRGERTLREEEVAAAGAVIRHPFACPGADRVRLSFGARGALPDGIARVYELEVLGR